MVAGIEAKVIKATPVEGVDCFLTKPKFLASLSKSLPVTKRNDCLSETPDNSSYRMESWLAMESTNKSRATVPGLVSKSGWANLKKSMRLKIISFAERIVTINHPR